MRIESRVWTHSDNIDENPQRPVAARVSRAAGEVRRKTGIKYPLLLALAACILALCGCAEQASSATAKPVETPVGSQRRSSASRRSFPVH